jgi:hypothetical protein
LVSSVFVVEVVSSVTDVGSSVVVVEEVSPL